MKVRKIGGNRQNASPGLVNSSAANRSKGMTNGLGGRTNGMTNGLGGRTNGLGGRTNGLTNGLGGRTNGLTNGLGGRTNGLTNGLGGKTNGLTNGLGSGGPVMRSRRMDDSAISPFRISLIIVIAFIIMVPASFMLLSYNEAAYSGLRVDGDFSDWDEVTMFTDAEQYSVANLDIVDYAAGTNDAGSMFFYASARGNWFSGSAADSLMVFIDSDGNPDTGYSIRGMGSDYLIDVYGWNSLIQGRQLGVFSGQDQLNWSAWNWRGASAALTLTEIEVGIQGSTVQLQPTHSFLFISKSGASVADICDAAIGLNGGALTVRQTPGGQAGIVDANQLMTLELRALGSAVNVSAIGFAYSGIAVPTVGGLPVTVQPGTPVTLTVTSPVTGLLNGTFIDLSVSTVTSTGVASVTGETLSAYAHAAPGTIRVDGAFADWSGITKATDTDVAANRNIDISRHASVNNSLEAFFYLGLGTGGRMFGGSSVPQARTVPATPGEPGEPTTPVPLPRVSGEDITRIYIDTVPGGQIAYGILADYLIEIKGREGEIISQRMYSLPGRVFVMNVDAANSGGELEVGVELGDIGFNTTLGYVMESTDWQGGNDRTAPASTIPLTRGGTRAAQPGQEIDNNWYNSDWGFRNPITIDNTGNSNALTNYQVSVTVTYDSDMQIDFDDIRFTDNDGKTLVDYWLESKTDSTTAKFWVEVPSIAASGTKTIFVYYGNPTADSISNGDNTFQFFDDFNDNLINTTKWDPYDLNGSTGIATETSGEMHLTVTVNSAPPVLPSKQSFSDGILECKAKVVTSTAVAHLLVDFRYDGSGKIQFAATGNQEMYFYDSGFVGRIFTFEDLNNHLNEWHFMQAKYSGTSVWGYIKNLADSNEWSNSGTVSTISTGPIGLCVWQASAENAYDDLRVRQYTSPEPTTSVGSPEVQSLNFLTAPYVATAPGIDGDYIASEWSSADNYIGINYAVYVQQDGSNVYFCVRVNADTTTNALDYCDLMFEWDNAHASAIDSSDRMFEASDSTATNVQADYDGQSGSWRSAYISPYTWSAVAGKDPDADGYIVYEFALPFQEVWGTANPSHKIVSLGIHIHDEDGTTKDYRWGGSSEIAGSSTDPSTWGNLDIPEFPTVAIPILICVIIPLITFHARRKNRHG